MLKCEWAVQVTTVINCSCYLDCVPFRPTTSILHVYDNFLNLGYWTEIV